MPDEFGENLSSQLKNRPDYDSTDGNAEVIVKYNGDLNPIATELNGQVEQLGDNYAILTLPAPYIAELYRYKQIEYIELPKELTLSLRRSLSAACITPVHNPSLGYNVSGHGVIIGIIDSGIDCKHPDFRDSNGDSRVLFLWDQTQGGAPPAGFFGGTEYTNAQLNDAIRNDTDIPADFIGHGTAVAGIAAGNGRSSGGDQTGVAPEAAIIVVKLGEHRRQSFARTTDIMRALHYIVDKASALNMPVAINLSFGTNNGSHTGNSLFESYIDEVSRRWKTVIVAASGNEGFAGHHYAQKIGAGQTAEAAFIITENIGYLYATLWKNFSDDLTLELLTPGGRSTGKLNPLKTRQEFNFSGMKVTVYYGKPSFYNDQQEVFIEINAISAPITAGLWRLLVTGDRVVDGIFHIWLPTIEEVGVDTAFLTPNIDTTLTLPSTAKNVLSVGGYNAFLGSAADFSGRGYTYADIYIKPDLVAPGTDIFTTRSGGGYDTFSGTSMAAPFVTGAAALMMEWGIIKGNDPFLYGQRVKAFLQKTATRSSDLLYPNPQWGYGRLCLQAAMNALKEYTK